jgi:chromosome segregation ATPase
MRGSMPLTRLANLDGRVEALEIQAERRALETKPIWEQALARILEVQQDLSDFRQETNDALRDLTRKIKVLNNDMMQLRSDQEYIENRVDLLEAKLQPQ